MTRLRLEKNKNHFDLLLQASNGHALNIPFQRYALMAISNHIKYLQNIGNIDSISQFFLYLIFFFEVCEAYFLHQIRAVRLSIEVVLKWKVLRKGTCPLILPCVTRDD